MGAAITMREEHAFRALVENLPTMIWQSGVDGKAVFFNQTWLTFTGRTLEQELDGGWSKGVHPEDIDTGMGVYLAAIEKRRPFEMEYRLRRHDGVYRNLLCRGVPLHDESGAYAGFLGCCTDIGETRLHDPSAGLAEFFEMALDNFCVSGFDGYFKRVNPSWTKTLGWTPAEMMARPTIEFVHPDDRAMTLAARDGLKRGEPTTGLVNRYLCKDGSFRWFAWRSIAHAERGVVYAVARDVTAERKALETEAQLQKQLVHADRMASLGTLAAGVAHEINNPLTYVIANMDLLVDELRRAPPSDAAKAKEWTEMATEARQGADRIQRIVRELGTFTRVDEEVRDVIDVRPVIERSIRMSLNEIKHRATLTRSYGDVPHVRADEARLGQVFVNLLVNAAQAIPEHGADEQEIRVLTTTDDAGRAIIEVQDTGSGITPNVIGRIFDPFFTTKPVGVGTGLGLSICHTIVTGFGGTISVHPREGRGTTFRVVLPPSEAPPSSVREPPPAPTPPTVHRRATILIIDDEPSIGLALGRIFRGHEVTFESDPIAALDLLLGGASFDVVFSDLMMPRLSGMDLYDELARKRPDVIPHIVLITGGAFTPAAVEFLARVPNDRIAKPFEPSTLRALVQRLITPT